MAALVLSQWWYWPPVDFLQNYYCTSVKGTSPSLENRTTKSAAIRCTVCMNVCVNVWMATCSVKRFGWPSYHDVKIFCLWVQEADTVSTFMERLLAQVGPEPSPSDADIGLKTAWELHHHLYSYFHYEKYSVCIFISTFWMKYKGLQSNSVLFV